jgi:tRNA pseudouridine38-40 synthase
MRVALQIAYDGYGFHGYARQPGLRTVEGELKSLFHSHGITSTQLRSASRTDKHVSALCNVVAFDTTLSEEDLISFFRSFTNEILIYGYAFVDETFYPRHASLRRYRYFLPKAFITIDSLLSTLCLFTGEHDFRNFARIEPMKDPIRSIDTIVVGTDTDLLWIDFYASTFLWHQIRRIISAILRIGKGKSTLSEVQHALDNPDVAVDFGLAPAEPLILKDVCYDSVSFTSISGSKRKLNQIEKSVKARSIGLFS